jgi:hypothetical protein
MQGCSEERGEKQKKGCSGRRLSKEAVEACWEDMIAHLRAFKMEGGVGDGIRKGLVSRCGSKIIACSEVGIRSSVLWWLR